MRCSHCGCALMRYSLDFLGLVCANPDCRKPREITSPLAAPEAPDSSGVATLAESYENGPPSGNYGDPW